MAQQRKKPLVTTIAATEARVHFGDVLKRVHNRHEHVTVEKDGLPIATIISQADYEEYRGLLVEHRLTELNRAASRIAQAAGYSEEQALADLERIKHESFIQQYGHAIKPGHTKHG